MKWSAKYSSGIFTMENYPFPQLISQPVKLSDIESIIFDRYPVELWMKNGDIVFFPREQIQLLYEVNQTQPLPFESRIDVWGLLLEIYLDTSFTAEDKSRTAALLLEVGIDSTQAKELRHFASCVGTANFFWWEWSHLGLFDLFLAMSKSLFHLYRISPENYKLACQTARLAKLSIPVLADEVRSQVPKSQVLWEDLGRVRKVPKALVDDTYNLIVRVYCESHRLYHDENHLEKVLEDIEKVRTLAKSWNTLFVAAVFHDFIYSSMSRTNEEDSARLCLELTKAWNWSESEKAEITSHIISTKDHLGADRSKDFGILSNADLKVFGLPQKKYEKAVWTIYREFRAVPWIIFRKKRIEFLEKFLVAAKDNKVFCGRDSALNQDAAFNIERELTQLKQANRIFRPRSFQ